MAQRRQSFRPRPLDPFKQLPVYRDASIFDAILEDEQPEEGEALDKAKADKAKEKEKEEKEKAAQKKKKKAAEKSEKKVSVPGTLTEQLKVDDTKAEVSKTFNLPVPETEKTSTFDKFAPKGYKPANAYIRHRLTYHDDYTFSGDVEYELTLEDEEWLRDHAKIGPKAKQPLSEDLMERAIDLMERKTGRDFPPPQSELVALCRRHLGVSEDKAAKAALEEVYNYWIQKRHKLRKPLLRRFWPITAPNDSSPNLTFRPREKERYRLRKKRQNDMDSYEKLVALRGDFEMLKCLLQLVRRREHLREIEAKLLEDEFEQALWETVKPPASDKRPALAPLQIDVGPLDQAHVDAIFEVQHTPVKASTPSPGPSVGAADQSAMDLAMIEADAERRRKKKRKRQEAANAGAAAGPLGAGVAGAAPGEPGVATAAGGAVAGAMLPPPPAKPNKPQLFLADHGLDYANSEHEACLPVVPTFPPSFPSYADLRRKYALPQDTDPEASDDASGPDAVEFAAGEGNAAKAPLAKPPKSAESDAAPGSSPVAPSLDANTDIGGSEAPAATAAAAAAATAAAPTAAGAASTLETGHDGEAAASAATTETAAEASSKPSIGGPDAVRCVPYLGTYALPTRANRRLDRRERPRFRFRPRIGRGGRYIVDRIPLPLHSTQGGPPALPRRRAAHEVMAGPDPYETGQEFLDPCKPRNELSFDLSFPSSKTVALTANQRAKVNSIYLQEDSEDEEVTVLDYPYLAPLQLEPEEAARLEAPTIKGKSQKVIRETKFRFII